jgi:hypothetical protein
VLDKALFLLYNDFVINDCLEVKMITKDKIREIIQNKLTVERLNYLEGKNLLSDCPSYVLVYKLYNNDFVNIGNVDVVLYPNTKEVNIYYNEYLVYKELGGDYSAMYNHFTKQFDPTDLECFSQQRINFYNDLKRAK